MSNFILKSKTTLSAFVIALSMLSGQQAFAKPGFYAGLDLGYTLASGSTVDAASLSNSGIILVNPVTTDFENGASAGFQLGFNFLGYAALEVGANSHAYKLSSADDRQWAAHWNIAMRVFPMWPFERLIPEYLWDLEPSLLIGTGGSYSAYTETGAIDPIGYGKDFGTLHLGVGLSYYVAEMVNVYFDYRHISAGMDTFIFNADDGVTSDINPAADTRFHRFALGLRVHAPVGDQEPPDFFSDAPSPHAFTPSSSQIESVESTVDSTNANTHP